jgi:hypothetical protein
LINCAPRRADAVAMGCGCTFVPRSGAARRQAMAGVGVPVGIDRVRHQDLAGRNRHVWWRRGALALVAALPILGLLNVFGQRATPTTYESSSAVLTIDSPARVRGGLIFTTEIVITPRGRLTSARLYLDRGWFKAMTFNGAAPQPSTESAQGRWTILDFGQLPAAVAFRVWISWQTNPTNLGRHSQDVELYDGGTQLMNVHRTLTVFP